MNITDIKSIMIDAEVLKPREQPKFVIWSIGFGPPELRWVCDIVVGRDGWELLARAQGGSPEGALKNCRELVAAELAKAGVP